MCRLKQWHPKSLWRNIHSQEPRAPKSCSIRAPIRAPKSCSIRVPDSGPEKSYTIRAPIRAPKSCSFRVPDSGPEKLFDSGPDSGPEKLFHSGPGFGPRKAVPFGPRVQALNCFQAGKSVLAPKTCSKFGPGSGPEVATEGARDSGAMAARPNQPADPQLVGRSRIQIPPAPIFCAE